LISPTLNVLIMGEYNSRNSGITHFWYNITIFKKCLKTLTCKFYCIITSHECLNKHNTDVQISAALVSNAWDSKILK